MKKLATVLVFVLLLALAASAAAQTVSFGHLNYEPIMWDVLSSDSSYTKLMTSEIIHCKQFGKKNSDWESSYIRSWLNNSFAYEAFTADERAALCPLNGDLVRLPSLGDVTNAAYGFASNPKACDPARYGRASANAISNGLWTSSSNLGSYYTLTPYDAELVHQVRADGSIGYARYDRENVGIRAVIIVRTGALQ